MPSTISAAVKPLLTSATSTESTPAISAPTIGMNPPKKVSTASGSASGTPTITSPIPMNNPSTRLTSTWPADEAAERAPDLAEDHGQVAAGARPDDAAHPRQEPVAVLDEQERQHHREQAGATSEASVPTPVSTLAGDGGDAALQPAA